jgi:agmatinase
MANSEKNSDLGIFGVPTSRETAQLVIIPVPWEVTTSYGGGTSEGPKTILAASSQVDLFDLEVGEAYRAGYHLEAEDKFFWEENRRLKIMAQKVMSHWSVVEPLPPPMIALQNEVNMGTRRMVERVKLSAETILSEGKIPAVIGGDHSTPLGLISALTEVTQGDFGVLHIDAHADLRKAYHGFVHSHASIMRNVMALEIPPARLVQVGIRDFCKEEYDYIQENPERIRTFFDRELKRELFAGKSWAELCQQIVNQLPERVYVSFDIDGLSPEYCPHTGTPVPGGLSFDQAIELLATLGRSGKSIIGFDLNEVAPGSDSEWDGNVGARILFKLCGWTVRTNGYE